jgi:hypothetical protein
MAASLQPPLSEYDLVGALTAHYSTDIQKCMSSAHIKSNQDALTFLGKMQALDQDRMITRDTGQVKIRNIPTKTRIKIRTKADTEVDVITSRTSDR